MFILKFVLVILHSFPYKRPPKLYQIRPLKTWVWPQRAWIPDNPVLPRNRYLSLRLIFRTVAFLFSHFLPKHSELRCLPITAFWSKRFPCLSLVWVWGCCLPYSQSKPMTQSVRKGCSTSWEVFNTKTCWAFEWRVKFKASGWKLLVKRYKKTPNTSYS